MATAEKILSIARKEIGTTENPKNSNKQKYGKEYGWNGVAWCVQFVWWCFQKAGESKLFYDGLKVASCSLVMDYAKKTGQWVTGKYQSGDLVIFDWGGDKAPDHIGIVEKVLSTNYIQTIEGNTSSDDNGDQSNGGGVYCRTRNVKYILGAYRPKYERDIEMEINEFIEKATDRQILHLAERIQKVLGNQSVGPKLAGEVANAKAEGISDGTRPGAFATRAEVSAMCNRTLNTAKK